MKEKKFQQEIREHGWEEFNLLITVRARCGGEHPGWVQNDVEHVIRDKLSRNGIMVDSCVVGAVQWKRQRLLYQS